MTSLLLGMYIKSNHSEICYNKLVHFIGYILKPCKEHISVKEYFYENSKETFKSSEVNITTQGKTFVGVVIGSASYKKSSRKF